MNYRSHFKINMMASVWLTLFIYQCQQWFFRLSIRDWCQGTSMEWESAFVSAHSSLREWCTQTVPLECELCESTLQCCFVLLGAGGGSWCRKTCPSSLHSLIEKTLSPELYSMFPAWLHPAKSAFERSSPSPWYSYGSIAFWEKLLKSKQHRQGQCFSPANSPPATPCLKILPQGDAPVMFPQSTR